MHTADKIILGSIMFGMVMFIGVALYCSLIQSDKVSGWQAACEQRGGILLQRTYQSGKYTNSLYTCIKKDVVIDYEP